MSCTAKHEKDKQTILVKWQWVQAGSERTTTTTVLLLPTSGKSPGWKPSFFPALSDRGTSNHVHVCMKACWDDGLATAPKSRSLKTLLMQRVTLLGAAQLPVSTYSDYSPCQSSLPPCFHLPADKCLYRNVAAVKGIYDSMYVSWNGFCRQPGLCSEVLGNIIPQKDNSETTKIQTIALILQEF